MEIVGMLAGVFACGIGVGFFLRSHLEGEPPQQETPRKTTCECAHSLAHHSPKEKNCNATIMVDKYNTATGRKNGKEWRECACLQYVGPPPPGEYFVLGGNG